MSASVQWLKEHKNSLIERAMQELSAREILRREARGVVEWFFDALIAVLVQEDHPELHKLLQNWVRLSQVPINGVTTGMLPVLGAFKRAIWNELQSSTFDDTNQALATADRIEAILFEAAIYLSKIEASALLDTASHAYNQQKTPANSKRSIESTFLSVAGHELKTPLTVIEGYTNMLRLEQSQQQNARLAAIGQGMMAGVVRMRELIEDLIDASLIESGLLRLDMQPVWLHHLLRIAYTELQSVLGQRNQSLIIEFDTIPTEPTVGNPDYLLKALTKVLSNAIKYTPDEGQIVVKGRGLKGFVDILVKDTGVGIDPGNLEYIFDSFSSLGDVAHHSSSKTNYKGGGPGLGLFIAKGILEAHQGMIWADSAGYDETGLPGSCFHIILPMRNISQSEDIDENVLLATKAITRHNREEAAKNNDDKPVGHVSKHHTPLRLQVRTHDDTVVSASPEPSPPDKK